MRLNSAINILRDSMLKKKLLVNNVSRNKLHEPLDFCSRILAYSYILQFPMSSSDDYH